MVMQICGTRLRRRLHWTQTPEHIDYPMFDWDDLRIFLAASRAHSLAEAAKKLGLDPATVGRRIARLETALGSTLFARSQTGLRLTAAGTRLLEAAVEAEGAMEAVGRAKERAAAGGTVRLSVAEGFGVAIVAPALPALRQAKPSLRIELAAQTGFLSPSKREVDLAVTLSPTPSSRVVIEPLADYHLGLFASDAYLASASAPKDVAALQHHAMIGYIDDLLYAPELRYLEEIQPGLRLSFSSSSILAQREIVTAGGGVGVLPLFLAEGLTRVLPDVRLTRRFWLSIHRDVLEVARVRAVRDWLLRLVKSDAQAFTRA